MSDFIGQLLAAVWYKVGKIAQDSVQLSSGK